MVVLPSLQFVCPITILSKLARLLNWDLHSKTDNLINWWIYYSFFR